ncbi:MAG: Ppx/GppA family phosphatase [Hyphomicrobiaceae bacterium]|nr:Ppx/GppA family phosphatase [Hyphomicrobiaceae bacterium]
MPDFTSFDECRGKGTCLEPIAVIDIGSHSVRLVVYEGAVRSPAPLFNEKVPCGLGRNLVMTGRLNEESVQRTIEALARFRGIVRNLRVKNVRAVATAAVREASNGASFIAAAERTLGWPIQILSGEREAELAAYGIEMGFRNPDGIAGDLGGGSLELIDIVGGERRSSDTLPLGGLRLQDEAGRRMDRALEIVDGHIAALPWLPRGRGRTFFAVGGTWRALGKLHMTMTGYPLRVMHGYRLTAREALELSETIRKARRIVDLKGGDTVSRVRREVLPYGALVLERLVRRMEPSDIVFSVFGIREGLLYSLLGEAERRKDPLVSFAEDYARRRSRSVEHAHELGNWTDQLFVEPGPKETEEERRLRRVACLLSDIGWRAMPDYRGEQSLNVIAHAALNGIDHPGRVFLALTVYFRHVGASEQDKETDDDLSHRLKDLVSRRLYRRARILGAAIRAAHMLSIGMPGTIDETPVTYDGGKLVLSLPKAHHHLDGERLQRRFAALASLLDCTPQIRKAA